MLKSFAIAPPPRIPLCKGIFFTDNPFVFYQRMGWLSRKFLYISKLFFVSLAILPFSPADSSKISGIPRKQPPLTGTPAYLLFSPPPPRAKAEHP